MGIHKYSFYNKFLHVPKTELEEIGDVVDIDSIRSFLFKIIFCCRTIFFEVTLSI